MILRIISQSYTKEVSIAWLELNTEAGNFVIQPGHAPTILILARNKKAIYCLTTGKQESVEIGRGIADITRKKATIIIDEVHKKASQR